MGAARGRLGTGRDWGRLGATGGTRRVLRGLLGTLGWVLKDVLGGYWEHWGGTGRVLGGYWEHWEGTGRD